MTILVDSSVLIHAQRQPNSEISRALESLLVSGEAAVTGPVVAEFMQGARNQAEVDYLTGRISKVQFLEMDFAVWVTTGLLGSRLLRSGESMTVVDLSIAATAIHYGIPLFTLDRGFSGIPDLILYQPPTS